MKFPNKAVVEQIRSQYPAGTRVELVQMDDAQAPPVGTLGTVWGVDDTGSIMVHWDNGSGLNVVYGEDIVQKIPVVKTVCYGRTKEWYSRAEAEQFFFHAMMNSEGSEHNRYMKIYTELKLGKAFCTDEEE